jgi:hypothetical protein
LFDRVRTVLAVVVVAVWLCSPHAARTQPHYGRSKRGSVKVEAEVSARQISTQDTLILEVTVTTVTPIRSNQLGGQAYDRFEDPAMPGFSVVGTSSSQSTRITFGGGRAERVSAQKKTYRLKPKKAGRLKIGPARVRVKGRYHSSKPIYVTVKAGAVVPPVRPGQTPKIPQDKTDAFIIVQADKKSCYVGEQINVSWHVYHQTRLISFAPVTTPTADDFVVEELYQIGPNTQSQRQVLNGRQYLVTPLYRKALFPQKSGTLEVGSLEAEFSTVRSRYQLSYPTIQRNSSKLQIQVKELPQKGRPASFRTGNVGRFKLAASVDRQQVRAGEAVILKVKISGRGHPKAVELPEPKAIKGFKIRRSKPEYEVKAGDVVRGHKTYELILIGVSEGTHEIPPFVLGYFDPERERFFEARTQPLTVKVIGNLAGGSAKGAAGNGKLNVLKRSIKPLHRTTGLSSRIGPRFYSTLWFKGLVLLPVVVLLSMVLGSRLRSRLTRETEARRWRRARGLARRRFRVARQKMQQDDRSGFFAEVSRVLQELLSERVGEKVQGLTSDELRALLRARSIPETLCDEVIDELQSCDFARFAPAASSQADMAETLHRVRRLVGKIQKTRSRKKAKSQKRTEQAAAKTSG